MFAPDVNILIGFNYKEHKFHSKIAEFFNRKEYKELLILGSVKQNFQYKIGRWNTNAISFLICTINKIRSEQPGIDDIVVFNDFAGKRDPYDDELIAEDIISNKQKIKRLKMFLTADRDFSDILNKIFESEKIQGIKIRFLLSS